MISTSNNNGEWIQSSKIIFSLTVSFSRREKHSWYLWDAEESKRFIRERSPFLVSHNVCPNSNIRSGTESAAWAGHVVFCLDCLQSANVDFSSVTKDKNLYEKRVKHLILVSLLIEVLSNPASVSFLHLFLEVTADARTMPCFNLSWKVKPQLNYEVFI